jgi:hypothetical protein
VQLWLVRLLPLAVPSAINKTDAIVQGRTFFCGAPPGILFGHHIRVLHPSTHVREGPAQVEFRATGQLVNVWCAVYVYVRGRLIEI